MTFTYDLHDEVVSSAVREMWYDKQAKKAAVKLKGSNSTYVYGGVTAADYFVLRTAYSVGGEFARFKRTFGPGTREYDAPVARQTPAFAVGDRVEFLGAPQHAAVAGAMATVYQGGEDKYLFVTWDKSTPELASLAKTQMDGGYDPAAFKVVAPIKATFAYGTKVTNGTITGVVVEPFGTVKPGKVVVRNEANLRLWVDESALTVVEPEPVADEPAPNLVSLAVVPAVETQGARYTVRFEVGGVLREYTSNFASQDEALVSVGEIGKALDLTFVIKSIERFFD